MKTITRPILAASVVVLPVIVLAQVGLTWLSAFCVLAAPVIAIHLLNSPASPRRS
ncbi:MAG TPA: hypothetical protein VFC44_14940 [Candidatus Saccharimonadales bacterium]|nr:hypothetical protein [Candidatus Saccharimonadales bacterium]